MKKVKKEILLQPETIEDRTYTVMMGCEQRYKYTFTSDTYHDITNIKHYIEVEEPETVAEFIKLHGMPEKVVVEWLMRNFRGIEK